MTEIREILARALPEQAPASSISRAGAVAAGRRAQYRRRTGLSIVGVTGAVLLITVGGSVGIRLANAPDAVAAGPSASASARPPASARPRPSASTPTTTDAANGAPTAFDPLTTYVRYGWLPDEMTGRIRGVTNAKIDLYATYPLGGSTGGYEGAQLTVHAADTYTGTPQAGSVGVNGTSASWAPGADRSGTLRWRYAANGWAELSIVKLRGTGDVPTVAYRIANGLTFGVTAPLSLPYRLTGVPAGLKVRQLSVYRTPGDPSWAWHVRVEYSDLADEVDPVSHTFRALVVEIYPSSDRVGDDKKVGRPNTTVDGHPATVTRDDISDVLSMFDVNGLHVTVWAAGPGLLSQLPSGGVLTLYHQLTLQPGWTPTD